MAKIRLKYVNKFANKNRANKRLRYYFRLRGHKAIPLPGLPGCEEFMQAYAQALAGLPDAKPETGEKRIVPGTINALCVSYYRSAEWGALAPDTREGRRRIVEKFRLAHGAKRVDLLTEAHLVKIMSGIASPSSRRSSLKAIRHLLQHAVPTMKGQPGGGHRASEAAEVDGSSLMERLRDCGIPQVLEARHQGAPCHGACARNGEPSRRGYGARPAASVL